MKKRAPLVLLTAVVVGLVVYFGFRPRAAEASDGVVRLAAAVQLHSVTVTATNLSAEPISVELCTFHTRLGGGVEQPLYKPCILRMVALGPGESVTDQIPVERWLGDEEVWVKIFYEFRGERRSLKLPLPTPWSVGHGHQVK